MGGSRSQRRFRSKRVGPSLERRAVFPFEYRRLGWRRNVALATTERRAFSGALPWFSPSSSLKEKKNYFFRFRDWGAAGSDANRVATSRSALRRTHVAPAHLCAQAGYYTALSTPTFSQPAGSENQGGAQPWIALRRLLTEQPQTCSAVLCSSSSCGLGLVPSSAAMRRPSRATADRSATPLGRTRRAIAASHRVVSGEVDPRF